MIILKFLIIYLPFEVFILKWIPVSDQIYLLLRQIPDASVFLLTLFVLQDRLRRVNNIPKIGKNIDVFLFLFVSWAFVLVLLNDAELYLALANIKALLRYILLVYIIMILNPNQHEIRSILRWIIFGVVFQVIIGFIQFVGGIPVRDFIAARHVTEGLWGITKNFTGDRFEGVNHLMGTMGDNISYAMFLLVGLAWWVSTTKPCGIKYLLGIMFFFIPISLSGSRSATIAAVIMVLAHQVLIFGWRRFIVLMVLALSIAVLVLPFVIVTEDKRSFFYMFTSGYLESAFNQRLGIVAFILPPVFLNFHTVIGFSPDKYIFVDYVANSLTQIPEILLAVLPGVLEDVYWVALLVYYGLIGLSFFVLFYCGMVKKINHIRKISASTMQFRLGTIALLLLIIAVFLNLLNQAFEVRQFSFYLWLFCGLSLSVFRQSKISYRIVDEGQIYENSSCTQ